MKFVQAFTMAFKALSANKMRSFLTMLGIIIGVFAVSVLISAGQATTDSVTSQIQGLGSNMLIVNIRASKPYELTMNELLELRGTGGIADLSPMVTSMSNAKAGPDTYGTTIEGVVPGYDKIRSQGVTDGRFLTQSDLDRRGAVAVVGIDVCDELFGSRDVLGSKLTLLGREFLIVGILEEKGSTAGMSSDNRVIIPFTTAQRLLQNTRITQFLASAESPEAIAEAESTVLRFLERKFDDEDDYQVFNQSNILDTLSSVTDTLTAMLASIAGISLLVGGIGIMNIMLVSVSERTREIGIRKAIGAQRSDIMTQFLIEAVVLSLIGGLLGLVLAAIGVSVLRSLIGIPVGIDPATALLSIGFSMAVGVIFGSYPANRASKLRPIEALRYE